MSDSQLSEQQAPVRDKPDAEKQSMGQIPPAPVDEACLERVDALLDSTEQAIALVEQQDAAAPHEPGGPQTATRVLLSVVMPVYNEEKTLREIVRRVQAVALEKEIVIVDDCSQDGTREILADLENEPNIRVYYHRYNHGKGAALRTGFLHARGEIVLVQDADLEYDPADYERLLEPILAGECDVVYGSRFLGEETRDPSLVHRLGNWALTALSNACCNQRLTDMETCYKVFRRHVLEGIDIKQDRFGFEPEITAKLARRRRKIAEVPIQYHGRGYAEGKKIGLSDAFNAVYCIVRYALAD